MERTQFYSKEEIARDMGISMKTLLRRIDSQEDDLLKAFYRKQRLFSCAEREYILDRMHQIIGVIPPPRGGGNQP